MKVGILIFYLCLNGEARAGDVPVLENIDGNVVETTGVQAYVYSDGTRSSTAAATGRYLTEMGWVVQPVADVRGLNFWPISSTVRAAVSLRSRDIDRSILLDWTGEWAAAMGIPGGRCSVAIVEGSTSTVIACDDLLNEID